MDYSAKIKKTAEIPHTRRSHHEYYYAIFAHTIENDKTFAETTINSDFNELEKYLKIAKPTA